MKKTLLCFISVMSSLCLNVSAQTTPESQMEHLDRGLIALPRTSGGGMFVSWRLLGTDNEDLTTFDLMRNGKVIKSNIYQTSVEDTSGSSSSEYQVITKLNGLPIDTSAVAKPWASQSLTIKLDRPANGTGSCTYTPNDCSVGDVDGDGQYEIILKWDPSNSRDNSQSGSTGNVYLDCYRLDGTKLWRIDLGSNIRAGAHYTQFMVYDFDGDGKAEVICKTASGSKDGAGKYVNQAATDATIKGHDNSKTYRNSSGFVLDGPEYLTVFEGLTGKAIHTIWYLPNRAGNLNKSDAWPKDSYWGKSDNGNRADRFLAAVAYLDGADKNPSVIMTRGYYMRAFIWAVDYRDGQLHTKWLHDSESKNYVNRYIGDELAKQARKAYTKNTSGIKSTDTDGGVVASNTMYGNGNHNISIADVDGDGCDEIIWGAGAVDNDGTMLYATGYGHGDAMHVSDLLPDRPGLEVFDVHEEKVLNGKGSWDLHDAATGEIIYFGGNDEADNGRGLAADISADNRGFEFWSSDDRTPRSAVNGKSTSPVLKSQSVNFRIYWNGDLQDELLDGHYVSHDENGTKVFDYVDHIYITEGNASRIVDLTNRSLCNTTKMTPNLSADILGDWREEMVLWDYNNPSELYIHSTTLTTKYRIPTLMHDHVYRMGICWQNTAYNQPPHLGYFLPDLIRPKMIDGNELTVTLGETVDTTLTLRFGNIVTMKGVTGPDGNASTDIEAKSTAISGTHSKRIAISGKPLLAGDYKVAMSIMGYDSKTVKDTITIHCVNLSGIRQTASAATANTSTSIYDAAGRRMTQPLGNLPRGIYIIKKGGKTMKITK